MVKMIVYKGDIEKGKIIGKTRLEFLNERLTEGYTEVAFGAGVWTNGERVTDFCVCFHPEGGIMTYEERVSNIMTPSNYRSLPYSMVYKPKWYDRNKATTEFDSYKNRHKISFGATEGLADLLAKWNSQSN